MWIYPRIAHRRLTGIGYWELVIGYKELFTENQFADKTDFVKALILEIHLF